MRKHNRGKKLLCFALALCLCMALGLQALAGEAPPAAGGCTHVHDASCGYAEAKDARPCTFAHVHDASCGFAEAVAAQPCGFVHAHNAACGFAEAVTAQTCGFVHVHDAACGYDGQTEETCTFDPAGHVHDAACGFAEAVEAQPCGFVHAHNAACGFAKAKGAQPCAVEAAHAHSTACGYAGAVAAAPCTHVHSAACGGLPGNTPQPKAVTAFAALDFAVQYRDVESGAKLAALALPATLLATVDGVENTEIPGITWKCEGYDDAAGMTEPEYVWTAVLPEGYERAAMEGTGAPPELPQIFALVDGGGQMTVNSVGVGTQAHPHEITSAQQLAELAEKANAGADGTWNANTVYYRLMNDIDLAPYAPSGSPGSPNEFGWVPIGTAASPFLAQFDGNGKTITGLVINRAGADMQGLFGVVGAGAVVQNLNVAGAAVAAQNNVGIVAGEAKGAVQNCTTSGSTSGAANVGGVAGSVGGGTVANCYATGDVSGTNNVGGVAGSVGGGGTVANCYATGSASGTDNAGGVAGTIVGGGALRNCAALNPWVRGTTNVGRVAGSNSGNMANNIAFSGMRDGPAGAPMPGGGASNGADYTAAQITADGTLGGNFQNGAAWTVANGKLPILTAIEAAHPGLQTGAIPAHIVNNGALFGGAGTAASPYQITSADDLALLATVVNAGNANYNAHAVHYRLMNDIRLAAYAPTGKAGDTYQYGWVPIGTGGGFLAQFDGGGNTITGLAIDNTAAGGGHNQGLFGFVGTDAVVKNLNVAGASVRTVGSNAGIVAGRSSLGKVLNCAVSGSVSGMDNVGGVAGLVENLCEINDCYSTSSVIGADYVGGVAGTATNGSIVRYSYSTGSVSGTNNVGGVAGTIAGWGALRNCAALNPWVRGTTNVGRVAGSNSGGMSGNIAFSGMRNGPAGAPMLGGGDINGADYTTAEITADGTLAGNFQNGAAWTVANGKLPILTAIETAHPGLQTGAIPAHIVNNGALFGGLGTLASPYQITSADDLALLAQLVNAGNATYNTNAVHYRLMNDIRLAAYAPTGKAGDTRQYGWVPIGTDAGGDTSKNFLARFDGGGNTVAGLAIDNTAAGGGHYQGLFGLVGTGAVVQNLNVAGASVKTVGNAVGIVAGSLFQSTVQNCTASGSVSGSNNVGGVAGNVYSSTVANCYATGSVSGAGNVGGVVGSVGGSGGGGTVTNCYATGNVSGADKVGGVAGNISGSGALRNCAALNPWVRGTTIVGRVAGSGSGNMSGNIAFSGMRNGPAGAPMPGGDDRDINGFDYTTDQITADGTLGNRFQTAAGWTTANGKLPILTAIEAAHPGLQTGAIPAHIVNNGALFAGAGSETDPYQIKTADDLALLATVVNEGNATYNTNAVHYRLMNDISLAAYAPGDTHQYGWVPIGTDANYFLAQFDGGGNTVAGLVIDNTAAGGGHYQGLFGAVNTGAVVQNLNVAGASVKTVGSNVGIVAGSLRESTVQNCAASGSVSGAGNVGGVVGFVNDGTVENCYTTGNVSGTNSVGGVTGGVRNSGTVANCYATGNVSGTNFVGGVAGLVSQGRVVNCYATGSVSGAENVDGVAETVGDGYVEHCAALNPWVRGTTNVGRVTGEGGGLAQNTAFNQMGTNGGAPFPGEKTHDGRDGADMHTGNVAAPAFWQQAGGLAFDSGVWTFRQGYLPILNSIESTFPGVQNGGDIPLHLTCAPTAPLSLSPASSTFPQGARTVNLTASFATPANISLVTFPVITFRVDAAAKNAGVAVTASAADGKAVLTIPAAYTGTVTVTAANANSGFSATATVTVRVPATGVTLRPTTLALTAGETTLLEATVSPADATDKRVTWASSNPAIASVDSAGNVTAHRAGTATITVTTVDGKHTATCAV